MWAYGVAVHGMTPTHAPTARTWLRRGADRVGAMASRVRALAAAATMVFVALVVAHNLIFVVEYGWGFKTALSRTGHTATWSLAVEIVLLAGFAGVLVAAWQLTRLSRRATELGLGRLGERPGRRFGIRWLVLSARLLIVTVVLFTAQENLEHLRAGLALPGPSVLLPPGHPYALLVIAVVAIAVAFLGALFGWRFEALRAWLRAAQGSHGGAPPKRARPRSSDQPRPGRRLGPGVAVRAPPEPALI